MRGDPRETGGSACWADRKDPGQRAPLGKQDLSGAAPLALLTAQPLSRHRGLALTCSRRPAPGVLAPTWLSISPWLPGQTQALADLFLCICLCASHPQCPLPSLSSPGSVATPCGANTKARAFQSLGQGGEAALDPRACNCAERRGRQAGAAIGPFPRPGRTMSPQQGTWANV